MFIAAVLPASLFAATATRAAAASKPVPAPVPAPIPAAALEPVSLHAWAKDLGGEVAWVEKSKTLRLKVREHDVLFELGRREIMLDGVRVFLGEAPKAGKRTLTISPLDRDHLLRPLLLAEKLPPQAPIRIIALDAGHGGKDKGTTSPALKLFEKDLALDVVQRLKPLLEARGFKVVLTRTDDTFIDLGERPKRAAQAGADLFLAVHFNAGPPTVSGIETYTLTPQFQRSTASDEARPEDLVAAAGNAWDGWNTLLGYSIHRQLQRDLGRFDRGLKRARFVVIRDLGACPGVLIECGYLSNNDEAKLINTPAHRDRLAAAIAAGVDAFVLQLPVAPAHEVRRPAPAPVPAPTAAPAPSRSAEGAGAIRAPRAPPAKPGAP
jgi:N-acetylmuramoyl-L-alanine amidase